MEGAQRLAGILGLPDVPHDLSGLSAEGAGLTSEDVALLTDHVATTAGAGGGFSMPVRARARLACISSRHRPPPRLILPRPRSCGSPTRPTARGRWRREREGVVKGRRGEVDVDHR